MRSLIRSIAFAFGLVPAIAAAQIPQFPQQLPANTVVGRLGVGPGPSQAIPITNLIANAGFTVLPVTPGSLACFSGSTGKIQSCPNTVVWNGVPLALAAGGTNNGALAASAGGIVWSDSTKLNLLAGTASANLCLLSGSNAAPTWGSCAGGSTVASIAGNTGAFTLNATSGITNTVNDIKISPATSAQFGAVKVDNTTITATAGVISTVLPLPGPLTNSLGSNVALGAINNYTDGPSVAQGVTGTWWASGTVTLTDTVGISQIDCKLWDGTTVISAGSTQVSSQAASQYATIALSGFIVSPTGNIRITCRDITRTTGTFIFNNSGTSKDSTLSVRRIL